MQVEQYNSSNCTIKATSFKRALIHLTTRWEYNLLQVSSVSILLKKVLNHLHSDQFLNVLASLNIEKVTKINKSVIKDHQLQKYNFNFFYDLQIFRTVEAFASVFQCAF